MEVLRAKIWYNTRMNTKPNELRDKLEKLFAEKTQANREAAYAEANRIFDPETAAAYKEVSSAVRAMIAGNLDPENRFALPNDAFMDYLRTVLSFRTYATYESWSVRKDVTEKELLAAARFITKGALSKLKGLRDSEQAEKYVMPMGDAYRNLVIELGNLGYFFVLLAHQAKRYGSFAAARPFLRAASMLRIRVRRTPLRFAPETIETLVDLLNEGVDELRIAADYAALSDWKTYAARERKKFKAALEEEARDVAAARKTKKGAR